MGRNQSSHLTRLDMRFLDAGWDLNLPLIFLCVGSPPSVCVPELEKAQLEKASQSVNQLVFKAVVEEAGASRKCHLCTMATAVGYAPLTSE